MGQKKLSIWILFTQSLWLIKLIFFYRPIIVTADVLPDQALYKFQLKFNKTVTKEHCWQLFLQFKNPFYLNEGDAYAVWDQGMLVARPARKSITIA